MASRLKILAHPLEIEGSEPSRATTFKCLVVTASRVSDSSRFWETICGGWEAKSGARRSLTPEDLEQNRARQPISFQ